MRALIVGAAGLVVAGLAVGTYLVVRPGDEVPEVPPPPITAAVSGPAEVTIPEGFLLADARSARPVDDQGMWWDRAEGRDLPPLVNPCGGTPATDADRVAARQVALRSPRLWKLERLVIYRDPSAAAAAMTELRDALTRCAKHPEADGTSTVWRSEALTIGEEAIFVAGQRMKGDEGLPGHYRGVLMRQGRTMAMFVDFGQMRTIASRDEVELYERDAATMADKIRTAPWN